MAGAMKEPQGKNAGRAQGWLLFFYSIPSRPVSNRMKIWRKLSKAGAVQIKGAVYVLPMNDEHYEFFQWLTSEVSSMGGEAAFTRISAIDSIKDEEIKALFNERQAGEYQAIGKSLDDLETRVNSIRKGSKTRDGKTLSEQFAKVQKNCEEALRTDFFSSKAGADLRERIDSLNAVIKGLAGTAAKTTAAVVSSRKTGDYQGRIWVSRKRPFVDRMASAWLIRNFIDRKATFRLVSDSALEGISGEHVTFDLSGGTFTHVGDLCTFEVLVKAFGLKDKAVRKIAEIVHELDIRDEKYANAESAGIEEILSGLRKAVPDDAALLEKGMSVFEMLYLSKSGGRHG